MRILVLEDWADSRAGGAERSMQQLCRWLSERHTIFLGYAQAGDYVRSPALADIYAATSLLQMHPLSLSTLNTNAAELKQLASFIDTNGIERIISHMVHVSPHLRLLGLKTGIPYALYFKWIGSRPLAGRKVSWGNRSVAAAAAVSDYVAAYWRHNGIPAERIQTVPEGVARQPERVFRATSATRQIGLAGRLVPDKGLQVAIDALRIVIKSVPDVQLRVAGTFGETPAGIDYKRFIMAKIADEGLAKFVSFDGFVSPLEPWLSSLDICVVPSIAPDAQPIVMMQSMAVATPIVASRIGGIPEVLAPCFDELLVPPQDAAALAERILALLNDPHSCASLGERLQTLARTKYSLQDHFSNLTRALGIA